MVATMKTKSALSYFGSDSEVAAKLASMLDACKHVTIPFCGGMSILPHLKARAIVANDLHYDVINFYQVMGGRVGQIWQQQLIEACETTLSHPAEVATADRILEKSGGAPHERAWAFWARCWIGRKGKGGTKNQGGMPSVRWTASGGTNASRIRAAAGDLHEWAKQFERCEWQSLHFRDLLPKVADKEGCGIYCDPPWFGAGEKYLHPFKEHDHYELAAMLDRFQETTVVVRYGDDSRVRELYPGYRIIDASSRDQCNATKGEVWLTNK